MQSTPRKKSLRIKMLSVIGGVVIGLMLLISFGILIQWRSMILQQLQQNAESITQAFGISVLDALIYGENENFQVEDLLESYISDLKAKVPAIRSIVISDNRRRVIAHSNPQMYNRVLNDSLSLRLSQTDRLISGIYKSPSLGWIVETVLPLRIFGKRWGVLRIAFDAESTRREIGHLFLLLLAITVLLTVAVLLVLRYLIDRTVQSLQVLVKAMDAMELESGADLSLPEREDEVGALIRHFEMLRKRLAASKEQLLLAQKQIYQAEKLASVGRLASGVAHEINNPLNGIKHCLYAIQKEPENRELVEKYLQLMNEGLEHIEAVVQKLLGFSRKSASTRQAVDLNESVRKVLALLEYRLNRKQVDLQLDLAPDLPEINGDDGLLKEVIMNLLLNSFDAVAENGHIAVKTALQTDNRVVLIVKDDGSGMAPEVLDKIFDPFYTTKPAGEGTGLGLSVALGIVEAHGGQITAQSTPGQGSTFTVVLPIGDKHEDIAH